MTEAIRDARAFLESLVSWPDDDWQGLRYHALEQAKALKAAGAAVEALQQAQEQLQAERLRVEHARKQGDADGFQKGWHAAWPT